MKVSFVYILKSVHEIKMTIISKKREYMIYFILVVTTICRMLINLNLFFFFERNLNLLIV